MEGLVSVITPVYNGERYIEKFLRSVLGQTYSRIELIIIDDGSTDKTKNIIENFRNNFFEKGYKLIYKFQEHAGQASALNKGLKIFRGEFLTWPDADDFLSYDAIEIRVKFLVDNPKYGFVRSDAAFYLENNIEKPFKLATDSVKDKYKENLFEALLFQKDSYVCNGAYFVRTDAFIEVIPSRQIYASNGGQNWQMLIPLARHFLCGYIDKPLYHIVVRKDSHSRSYRSFNDQLERCDELEDILLSVISQLDVKKSFYTKNITEKYNRKRFKICLLKNDIQLAKRYYSRIKNKSYRDFFYLLKLKFKQSYFYLIFKNVCRFS